VGIDTPMRDVIYEISKKGLGVTAVVGPDNKVAGVITDGDLRRLLQQDESMVKSTAGACMHPKPLTISKEELAAVALRMMEEKKVTSLLVASSEGVLEGVIHIHDLWQTQMF